MIEVLRLVRYTNAAGPRRGFFDVALRTHEGLSANLLTVSRAQLLNLAAAWRLAARLPELERVLPPLTPTSAALWRGLMKRALEHHEVVDLAGAERPPYFARLARLGEIDRLAAELARGRPVVVEPIAVPRSA